MVLGRLDRGGRGLGLHVGALSLAPLSIVQAVLSGGLVFLAVLAERFFGFQLGRRQWVGVTITAAGLVVIGLTGGGANGTPHNPTGSVVGAELLVQLRDLVANHGAQLVVDEVYHPIYHGPAPPSAATLTGATTIGDLSKALSLGGLRTGWIIEHDRARFEQYVDARSYLTISNSPIDEALAAAAIRSHDTIIARAQAVAEQNLATLDAFVGEHDEPLGWVRPRGGLTAFPWLRSGADSRPFCIDAAAAGVLVAPGDCFDMPSHLRIGFGATEHGFAEAVTRLGEVLAKHG